MRARTLTVLKEWFYGPYSRLGLAVALPTCVIDQAHKVWMIEIYDIATKAPVRVTAFLDLVYTLNKGISYGMLTQDTALGQALLAGFAAVAVAVMAHWLARHTTSGIAAVGLGLVMGGAIGNAIDRFRLGGVADFFSVHAHGFYWYVFNIADVAIVAGVVCLLYDWFWPSRNAAQKAG
ncbi:MAG: signal peptidase II [Hyphomicrobiaceae bacterium]